MLSKVSKNGNKELAKQTADIIKEHWQAAYSRFQDVSLECAVFHMLGSTDDYSDNICDYELQTNSLLEAMANPEVCKALEGHLGASLQRDIIKMLGNLSFFFKRLDGDYFRDLLDVYDLHQYPSGYSEQQLLKKQIEFKSKLAGLKAQQREEERLKKEAKLIEAA